MKKALGGCLVVALLLSVAGGGALWWFVLRPAWNAGSELVAVGQQWAELARIDERVQNRGAFAPPPDGVIPAASLERFLAVQRALDTRLGARLQQLDLKYREIEHEQRSEGRDASLAEVLGAYGDVFGLVREAREAQVDALNAHGLSLEEYRWLRTQAYTALGLDVAARAGLSGSDAAVSANVAALEPHRDMLVRTAATLWLDF